MADFFYICIESEQNSVIFIIQPVPLRNAAGFLIVAIFCILPDLAVFRQFPGLSPVGWYKLSSAP